MSQQTTAVSLRETLVQTRQEDNCGLEVTASGIVTFFSGNVINNYYDTGKSFEPWVGTLLGTSKEITAVKWCKGMEPNSGTPLYNLISDKSGNIFLLDMVSRKTIRTYVLTSGYVVSIIWHQTSINHFFVATSAGDIIFFEILPNQNTFDVVWSLHVDFKIEFFLISPHNGRELLIASTTGQFGFIYIGKDASPTITPIMALSHGIVDAKFYPYIDNTVVFISATSIFLFVANEKALLPIYFKGSSQDPLITAYFPNPYNERSILLIFSNRCEYYESDDLSCAKPQIIPFLTPFQKHKLIILKTAFTLNKLYVLGNGNTIQLFELRNKKFWCTRIARTICDAPSDYDCFGHSMCYVTDSGYLHISNTIDSSAITKYFSFQNFSFHQATWLSETSLLVSLSSLDQQKVFYIDISTLVIKSLLNPSMEKMSTLSKKPLICVSPSKKMIAVVVDLSVIMFYSYEPGNLPENFKMLFVDPGTIGSFASDNEFWTFSMEGKGHKYKIDLKVDELVYASRISYISKQIKHQPNKCECIGDYLCVGFENGDFGVYSWYGNANGMFNTNSGSITSITPSGDHSYCYVSTSNSNTFKFTADGIFDKTPFHAVNIKFLTSSVILLFDKNKRSLTLSPNDINQLYSFKTQVSSCLNDQPLMKTSELRLLHLIPKERCSIQTLIDLLNKNMFYFISDILSCVDKKRYSPSSLCVNFDEERMQYHLKSILEFFSREENGYKLKTDRVRILLMRNKNDEAFALLKDTPTTDPNFALNILKMSLIGIDDKNITSSLSPSVAAMIAAGKFEDAIDILMLSHQYSEAARQLIGNSNYTEAIQIMKTVMDQEKLLSMIDFICKALMGENRFKSIASILVSCRMFDDAVKILEKYKFMFPAALIKCLKEDENGDVIFDPTDFKLSDK